MIEKKVNTCKLCGYEWFSVVENPKQCPHCKRYDWDKEKGVKSWEIY